MILTHFSTSASNKNVQTNDDWLSTSCDSPEKPLDSSKLDVVDHSPHTTSTCEIMSPVTAQSLSTVPYPLELRMHPKAKNTENSENSGKVKKKSDSKFQDG